MTERMQHDYSTVNAAEQRASIAKVMTWLPAGMRVVLRGRQVVLRMKKPAEHSL
jgi:hypothetical protein